MGLASGASAFIETIYAAGADAAAWDSIMGSVRDRLEARFVLLSVVDAKAKVFSTANLYGVDDGRLLDGFDDYRADFHKRDPSLIDTALQPYGGVWHSRIDMTPERREQDDFVRWSKGALGTFDWTVRYTPPVRGLTFAVSAAQRLGEGALEGERHDWFAMIFRHLENAAVLALRPPDLAARDEALLLVDAAGRIMSISPMAEAILATRDGICIQDGALRAHLSAEQQQLTRLLQSTFAALEEGNAGGGVRVSRSSGLRPFVVTVRPIASGPAQLRAYGACALVKIVDPAAAPLTRQVDRWRQLFGFTPAETRLAAALLGGDRDLREVAAMLGITYGTARVHLRNIFEKAEVRTQMELARLLTRA